VALVRIVGLAGFLVVAVAPIGMLVVQAAIVADSGSASPLELMLPTGRRLDLLLRSVGLAVAVGGATTVVGALAGSLLWQARGRFSTYLRWLPLPLALIPAYVHAMSWSSAVALWVSATSGLGTSQRMLEGPLASWWVQVMALAPISVGLAVVGFAAIDQRLLDAARVVEDDDTVFRRIVLPLAAPSLLGGGTICALLSLADYSVPTLFQMPVYSLEIFAEFSASGRSDRALLLAVPLVVISALGVALGWAGLRGAALRRPRSSSRNLPPFSLSSALRTLQWMGLSVFLISALVPLASMIGQVHAWPTFGRAVADAREELTFTLLASMGAALLSVPLAACLARELSLPGRGQGIWWLALGLLVAMPGPLVGIALVTLWNRSLPVEVYGTGMMVVLASVVRFLPFAAIIILAQLRRLDPLLLDAARILQRDWLQTTREVAIPLLLPGLLASAFLTFALAAGELGATLLVAPPGQATLTMRVFNLLHYGATESVAALALMVTATALVTGAIVVRLLEGSGAGKTA
jgi:iron(III) transport system permease protein